MHMEEGQEASFDLREVLTGYMEDLYHKDNWAVETGCPDILCPLQPQVFSDESLDKALGYLVADLSQPCLGKRLD